MAKILAGMLVTLLVGLSLRGIADERIPNAHGECAIPMHAVFQMADMAKDGRITRGEWNQLFDVIDQNKDGILEAQEVTAFEQAGMQMQQKMQLQNRSGAKH